MKLEKLKNRKLKELVFFIYSLRKSSSAKGTATLNDPNDPNRPGELIVNFGGFQRK